MQFVYTFIVHLSKKKLLYLTLCQISDVASGIGDSNKTVEIAEALEELIDSEMDQSESTNTTMKAGNINASLEAIDVLSEIHVKADKPPSQEEVKVNPHNILNYITIDGHVVLNWNSLYHNFIRLLCLQYSPVRTTNGLYRSKFCTSWALLTPNQYQNRYISCFGLLLLVNMTGVVYDT